MKGRKPKPDAIRRGGHAPQAVELVAEVVAHPAIEKPETVLVNPTMSKCWDDYIGQAPGFEECDVPLLEAYCYWYAVFQNAMYSTMTLDGRIATTESVADDEGNPTGEKRRRNPDLQTAREATEMIRKLGEALNISPTARVRSGLMRAMTASTQAEMVSKTLASAEEFRRQQRSLDAAK